MPGPSRRVLARYPCDLPVEVHAFLSEVRVAQGRFSNLNIGGALLRCAPPLERGVTYFFRFSWKETLLALPGRVARAAPHDPKEPGTRRYGIQFNLTRDQEQFLRGLVESLRLAAAPRGAQRDYWGPRLRG